MDGMNAETDEIDLSINSLNGFKLPTLNEMKHFIILQFRNELWPLDI